MRSILEEIRERTGASRRAASEQKHALRDDIIENLRRVFSTPLGSARAFMDLGLTDATQVYCEYPDAVVPMQMEVLSAIHTYEPRLTNVKVVLASGDHTDLRLRFQITATLVEDGQEIATSFLTTLDNDNHVTFR